jgi:hypothetical protein
MSEDLPLPKSIRAEGMASYLHGLPRENCPYPPDSDEREPGLRVGTRPHAGTAPAGMPDSLEMKPYATSRQFERVAVVAAVGVALTSC